MQTCGNGTRNQTIKDEKDMATLRDLCKDVPQTIDRMAVERELLRRKNASFLKRMGALCEEKNVFKQCQTRRPEKGKVKNRFSREEAGTIASVVVTKRFSGSRLTCVCKSKIY